MNNPNDLPLIDLSRTGDKFLIGQASQQGGLVRVPISRMTPQGLAAIGLPGTRIRACIFGDSIARYNNRTVSPTAVTWADGVATWTCTAHGFFKGQTIYHSGTSVPGFFGSLTVLQIDTANQFRTNVPPAAAASGTAVSAVGSNFADPDSLVDNWMFWANAYANGRFDWVHNAGLGGERVGKSSYPVTALERVDTELTGIEAQICFIATGINDCNDVSATALTPTDIYLKIRALAARILNKHGMWPIILPITPFESTITNFASIQQRANIVNHLLRNNASLANGYSIVDDSQYMTDFTTGGALTSPAVTQPDKIHLSKVGGRIRGKAIAAEFGRATTPNLLAVSALDNYGTSALNPNLIDRGVWTNSGGTVTGTGASGTLPAGWISSRLDGGTLSTVVWSVPARTIAADGDKNGYNIQGVFTVNNNEAFNPWIRCLDSLDTRIVAGGTYEMRVAMRLSNVIGSKLMGMTVWSQLTFLDPDTAFSYGYNFTMMNYSETGAAMDIGAAAGNLADADGSFVLRSMPVRFPYAPSAAANQFNVRWLFNAVTGLNALTCAFGRPTFVRVG